MPNERFIAVVGKDLKGLDRYLYSYASVIAQGKSGQYEGAVVQISTVDSVEYYTDYQAGRLSSNLWGTKSFAAAHSAMAYLFSDWGIDTSTMV